MLDASTEPFEVGFKPVMHLLGKELSCTVTAILDFHTHEPVEKALPTYKYILEIKLDTPNYIMAVGLPITMYYGTKKIMEGTTLSLIYDE